MKRILSLLTLSLALLGACDDSGTGPDPDPGLDAPVDLPVLGRGAITDRFTGELWVRGGTAYTTTWGGGSGRATGNALYVWNVEGRQPVLVDSVVVANAGTLGDVQATDDGRTLVVAVEPNPNGAILLFDLAEPRRPRLITRYASATTRPGVHTAEVATVGGRRYAFLSVDPAGATRAALAIVDITNPAAPVEVFSRTMGLPFIHDVFVRDGYLFTALWDEGLAIWDIGAQGGSPSNPVRLSTVLTVGGNVHNVWWYHDPRTGSKRYAFVGEEQVVAGQLSRGDIHVVDVSDLRNPREVAFFHVPDRAAGGVVTTYGTHNFSVDESRGILYAAYYNGGVRALDVRGDLGSCAADQKDASGRCDLGKMKREVGRALADQGSFVWGVQWVEPYLYASDMNNGLWKLDLTPLTAALGR